MWLCVFFEEIVSLFELQKGWGSHDTDWDVALRPERIDDKGLSFGFLIFAVFASSLVMSWLLE